MKVIVVVNVMMEVCCVLEVVGGMNVMVSVWWR